MVQVVHTHSPVEWALAPAWLTVWQAASLSGWNLDAMLEIVDAGGVDLNDDGLMHKGSLWDFQEACVLAAHWND